MHRIQSFVNRARQLSSAQKNALTAHWQNYGIDLTAACALDFAAVFPQVQPVVLDIGFGNGDGLVAMAKQQTEMNYLAADVYLPGVCRLLANIDKNNINNIKVYRGDVMELLPKIGTNTLAGAQLFFPDPWPKKKHHKRRLLQTDFLSTLAEKLVPGGFFHMATDWQDYSEYAMATLSAHPDFKNSQNAYNYSPRPKERALTKFEQRGLGLGHQVWDLIFINQRG